MPEEGTDPILMTTYPREETTSASVIFWAAAFIVVDLFWAVSALFLSGTIAGRTLTTTEQPLIITKSW